MPVSLPHEISLTLPESHSRTQGIGLAGDAILAHRARVNSDLVTQKPRMNFTKEGAKKPDIGTKAKSLHRSLTEGDVTSIQDMRWRWAAAVYRVALVFVTHFNRTDLTRRAQALTYTTILSFFPLLAVLSAMAATLYTEETEADLLQYLDSFLPAAQVDDSLLTPIAPAEREELVQQSNAIQDLRELIQKGSRSFRDEGGRLGIFGFVTLLVIAGFLYMNIRTVVNDTWQVEIRESWTETFTNVIIVIVLTPLIVVGISLIITTVAVTLLDPNLDKEPAAEMAEESSAPALEEEFAGPPLPGQEVAATGTTETSVESPTTPIPFRPLSERVRPSETPEWLKLVRSFTTNFGFLLKVLPLLINTLILAIAYGFLPHTRVSFAHALLGGFVAALMLEGARYLFIFYIVFSSVNQNLAELFGAAILALIWVFVTWIILLLGNLVVYVSQNYNELWTELQTNKDIAVDSRLYLALMLLLARRFIARGGGYTELELRVRLGLNGPGFHQIMDVLMEQRYVVMTKDGKYQLYHPPEQILAKDLLSRGCNLSQLPVARRETNAMSKLFGDLEGKLEELCGDASLRDILESVRLSDSSAEQPAASAVSSS